MSTPTVPPVHPNPSHTRATEARRPGGGLVVASFLAPLAYLIWFWVMFAFGYWVTDAMGAYPATDVALTELGLTGWLVAVGFALLVALPNWVGIALALGARRAGAGRSASVALILNVALAVAFVTLSMLP